jgi:acetolactate synthase-1/2/3 large subunit
MLSEASTELKALAELLAMPVATTLMGKGVFPEDHPLACGMTGIWGTRVANETMRQADVIVAIGTAFGEADCSSWRPEHTFAIPPSRLSRSISIHRRSARSIRSRSVSSAMPRPCFAS